MFLKNIGARTFVVGSGVSIAPGQAAAVPQALGEQLTKNYPSELVREVSKEPAPEPVPAEPSEEAPAPEAKKRKK